MMTTHEATVSCWLAEKLPSDVAAALARLARSDDVQRIAVMPDAHLAADVCIGTVIATTRLLYPQAVGGDIGCGMAAVRFDADAHEVDAPAPAARLITALSSAIPIIKHDVARRHRPLPGGLDDEPLSCVALERRNQRDGRLQFGTVGRGNHFVELQADDQQRLWLMVHSGSRAMGQAIRDHHLTRAKPSSVGLGYLDATTDAGRDYLADVTWALGYARANRRALVEVVAEVLGEQLGLSVVDDSFIDCDHNHVRRVELTNDALWVHRKGAIDASEGCSGIVPGSMGSSSFHVVGRGCDAALRSSSHGAGRALSRSAARRAISTRAFEAQVTGVWFDRRQSHRLREEAPGAYKDIAAVMRAQRELTRRVRELRPILSYKGA